MNEGRNEGMNEGMLNDTPAQNINQLLDVRQIVKTNFEIDSPSAVTNINSKPLKMLTGNIPNLP